MPTKKQVKTKQSKKKEEKTESKKDLKKTEAKESKDQTITKSPKEPSKKEISVDTPDVKLKIKNDNVGKTIRQKKTSPIRDIFSSLVGEKKELSKYWQVVEKIEALDEGIRALTDDRLKNKTKEFRKQLKGLEGKEMEKKILEILPEAFAVVREAAHRTIGQKHFPVQLIGGMVLNDGRIAEMKTGEGKTLASTLSAYLNALPEKNQVHVVTVNDYLARRDASWMGEVFDYLGLTTSVIQNQASFYFKYGADADEDARKKRELNLVETWEDGTLDDKRSVLDVAHLVKCERKRAYWDDEENKPVDIVYGVNSEFGFDYLRDNMANTPQEVVQKSGHCVAIVDEVDSILIDEARTPLIISSQDTDASEKYRSFADLAKKMNPDTDYTVDEKRKIVLLSELGMEKVERNLGIKNLYGSEENVVTVHHLDLALKAFALFRKDKEYVVRDGEIIIVDENTGRLMFGRRYNQGLHQAIEAKEGLNVKPESKTVASITFQNYFRLYDKLSGMTGTAATESEELYKIYKLLVVTIPTNKPVVREDLVDRVFKNETGKFQAIAKDVKKIHETGQPILIGTTSIEKNQLLGENLKKIGVPYSTLNAKNHEHEAQIISQAGIKGAVTLATNIAGRGVDIKLGGEIPENPDKISEWKKDHEEVKKLGGLFVIGTERHESRRIDNQLRGRSGRQGDPGKSQFYISLEDYILRVFGGDKVSYFSILPIPDDEPIQNQMLSKLIEEAQKKIEGQNYDIRKHVTDYDDVINKQRSVIYTRRKKVLMNEGFDWKVETKKAVYREVLRILKQVEKPTNRKEGVNKDQLKKASGDLKEILPLKDFDTDVLKVYMQDNNFRYEEIAADYTDKLNNQLNTRWEIYQENIQAALTRFVFLRAIDLLWTEHLVTIDHLNDSVRLRGYSQKDPLTEFKQEGMNIFISLLEEIDKEVANTIFKVTPELVPSGILKS
jgi:preprotein translocase subunit SecA